MTSFVIYERATGRPIGSTELMHIDFRNGRADFGIYIGEAEARGKGYGTETTRLMLDYAFTALGLRNVALTVAEWNIAGQRAYAKAGFREFGRRRACWPMGGRWWDEVHMDALASEFESPVLARVFAPDAPREGGRRTVTVRAIIVDIGGVLLLRDEMPAHSAWEDRLGIDRGGFARGLFRPDLAAQATVGAVSAAQVWEEMAARLSLD